MRLTLYQTKVILILMLLIDVCKIEVKQIIRGVGIVPATVLELLPSRWHCTGHCFRIIAITLSYFLTFNLAPQVFET